MRTTYTGHVLGLIFAVFGLPTYALTLPPAPPTPLAVNTIATGTFDLTDPATVPNFTNGDVALDIFRYDLGSSLNGSYDFNFTTFVNNNGTATLEYYILTDANDARFVTDVGSTSGLPPIANNLSGLIAEGLLYDPDYFAPHPGSSNSLIFNATTGTNYFAWVVASAGPGQGGRPLDFQVSLTPVPLPAALPLLLSGLTALGLLGRRRSRSK